MNIFFLDTDPVLAAQYQCDKHVVKMILETAQMLCTAHRVLDGERMYSEKTKKPLQQYNHPRWHDVLYKCAHINHPSTKWIRATSGNYQWAFAHFCALCDEYSYRYGKLHESDKKLRHYLEHTPANITQGEVNLNDFECVAIADDIDSVWKCKSNPSVVDVYRAYYLYKTTVISPFVYTNRSIPTFLLEMGYDYGAVFTAEEAPWINELSESR